MGNARSASRVRRLAMPQPSHSLRRTTSASRSCELTERTFGLVTAHAAAPATGSGTESAEFDAHSFTSCPSESLRSRLPQRDSLRANNTRHPPVVASAAERSAPPARTPPSPSDDAARTGSLIRKACSQTSTACCGARISAARSSAASRAACCIGSMSSSSSGLGS